MTQRTYRVTLAGAVTVDDAAVLSGMLGLRWYSQPGAPPLTDDELFEIQERVLTFTGTLPPGRRLQAFLANGPLVEVREQLARGLEERLPGARVTVEGFGVEEVALAEADDGG